METFNVVGIVELRVEGSVQAETLEDAEKQANFHLENFTPDMPFAVTSQTGYNIEMIGR